MVRESRENGVTATWTKLAQQLSPGERHVDKTVFLKGSAILYACHMSSSFGFFTLTTTRGDSDDAHCGLDVVLKKDDGWSCTEIASIMEQILNIQGKPCHVVVQGFLERVRAKHEQDSSPTCLHATMVRLVRCNNGNDEFIEWKSQSTAVPMNMTSSHDAEYVETDKTKSNAAAKGTAAGSNGGGWRGAKDDTRFSKFVAFLLETFGGYEALAKHPVLDIAGGAGGLAFELSVRHAIACVVVDIKPLRFKAKQVRHVHFRKECVERLQAQPNIEQSQVAQNLLRRFQVDCDLETLQFNQLQTLLDSKEILDTSKGARKNLKQDVDAERLQLILQKRLCSILCGMHPDQATDHIIDIGLALNIPWAVVPCCVFPSLFQVRRTCAGKMVRTYEDYCDFIRSKNPNIQEVDLPFRGRNKVFYWIPQHRD
jgi:hypothetical protein